LFLADVPSPKYVIANDAADIWRTAFDCCVDLNVAVETVPLTELVATIVATDVDSALVMGFATFLINELTVDPGATALRCIVNDTALTDDAETTIVATGGGFDIEVALATDEGVISAVVATIAEGAIGHFVWSSFG